MEATRELRYPGGFTDLDDLDLFTKGQPHEVFRRLRETAPVYWNPEANGPGYWVVTRYADVERISKQPKLFSNTQGHYISYDSFGIQDPDTQNAFLHMLLSMDPPEHNVHRRLIAPAFNPALIRKLEDGVRAKARELLDRVAKRAECDFVAELATPLPLWTLSELLGVPEEDRRTLIQWSNEALALLDPDYFGSPAEGQIVFVKMFEYGKKLMAMRREHPTEDLLSVMANTKIDGESLPDVTLDGFFVLMVLAGNETTRNTIAGDLRALTEFPEDPAPVRARRHAGERPRPPRLRHRPALLHRLAARAHADPRLLRGAARAAAGHAGDRRVRLPPLEPSERVEGDAGDLHGRGVTTESLDRLDSRRWADLRLSRTPRKEAHDVVFRSLVRSARGTRVRHRL